MGGLFDDIEDEVPPKAQGGWNASTEPAKPPKFQTADEPSANALNWMATGTADRSNPADIGKPPIKDTSHLGVPSARAAMLAKMH